MRRSYMKWRIQIILDVTMRFFAILSVLALSACSSETSTFEINGESVTRAEFEEYTRGSQTPTAVDSVADSGNDLSNLDPAFGDLADQLAILEDASIGSRSNSAWTAVPTSGSGTFEGVIVASTSGVPAVNYSASAETTISVDFLENTLTAENGQFVLLDGNLRPIETLNGDLGISRGSIRGSRQNSVEMSVSGTLTGDTTTMFVTGDLTGSFKASPMQGLTAGTGDATGIVNGVGAPTTVIAIEALSTN